MTNRDAQGRFVTGNQVALQGWAGLVRQRFGGDEATAKAWVGQLGRWAYGLNYRNADGQYMPWVKPGFRQHPGRPEQFTQDYNSRFDFTLADVPELEY